jgi:hypothetical protein
MRYFELFCSLIRTALEKAGLGAFGEKEQVFSYPSQYINIYVYFVNIIHQLSMYYIQSKCEIYGENKCI